MTAHPAQFSRPVLDALVAAVQQCEAIGDPLHAAPTVLLDPFGGRGGVHRIAAAVHTDADHRPHPTRSVAVEIEPEWSAADLDAEAAVAAQQGRIEPVSVVGDSRTLDDLEDVTSHPPTVVVTSPCYGNRMADTYLPADSDKSRRYTYTVALGRRPSEGSAAAMQWGPHYVGLHAQVWQAVTRAVAPRAFLVLNVKDHDRRASTMSSWQLQFASAIVDGEFCADTYRRQARRTKAEILDYFGPDASVRQPVTVWHRAALDQLGWDHVDAYEVDADRPGIQHSPTPERYAETVQLFRLRDTLPGM